MVMKYSELIELYKNGELCDDLKKKIEKDIERQDAISEYLFDREDAEVLENIPNGNPAYSEENDVDSSENFTKMIKSAIRKSFIKAGVIVGVVVLIVVCLIVYAFPKYIDTLYYNPSEIVAKDENGNETNRISLDLATYSELFLPENYRSAVDVVSNGNANYDIIIRQNLTYNGTFTNVGGKIDKGKMVLYNPNILDRPYINSFLPNEKMVETGYKQSQKTAPKDVLKSLDDEELYTSYCTLKKVMNYKDFQKWESGLSSGAVWCALCEKATELDAIEAKYKADSVIGFGYNSSCSSLGFDEEKYPLLTQFSLVETTDKNQDEKISEKNMKQHIVSMLNYMSDQEDFCKLVNFEDRSTLKDLAKSIEKDGIYIYGFVSVGTKEDISRLVDTGMIENINVSKTK